MGRAWAVLAVCGASACSSVCLTVYDTCRDPPDAGITALTLPDAAFPAPDASYDAGFAACIKPQCQAACAELDDPRRVCLFPRCLACQRAFCGRLYPCGLDASATDAALDGGDTGPGRDAAPRDGAAPG